MSTTGGRGRPGSPLRLRRVLASPLRRLSLGAGVVLLAVSGLFGGLDDADARPQATLSVAAVAELIDGEPWNVTVLRARAVADVEPALYLSDDANYWLVVVAMVEVTADESRWDISDVLRVADPRRPDAPPVHDQEWTLRAGRPDHVLLLRDATRVDRLHPGLPEEVGLFWELPGPTPVPAEIEVTVVGITQRVNSLTGHLDWLDPYRRALVAVPVTDHREGL